MGGNGCICLSQVTAALRAQWFINLKICFNKKPIKDAISVIPIYPGTLKRTASLPPFFQTGCQTAKKDGGQSELAIFFRFFWQFFSGFHFASFACVWHPIRVENRCPKMEPYNRLWLDYYATWL